MDEHILDAIGPHELPTRPEIAGAAHHIWRERSRYVIIEGDMGTGKTYLASLLTLQMFWAVHSGLWRELALPSGVPINAVCFANLSTLSEGWKTHVERALDAGHLDRAPDVGPHPCEVMVTRDHHRLMGKRIMMLVLEDGACWSPTEFAHVVRNLERRGPTPAQVVRINPFMHEAQWCGVEPGIFTMHETTIVRLRLPDEAHEHVWRAQHGRF